MNGGLNTGVFTHVYGEAAAGKTTFALQFVNAVANLGFGSIYINSEGQSPVDRLEQIAEKEYIKLEPFVKIFVPKGFSEQGVLIDDLDLYVRENTKLVVIDTLTKQYRLALEDKKTNYSNHRELNRQAGILKGLALQHGLAVLVLNQVTARLDGLDDFEPVAENIMDYWSDYVIKIKIGRTPGERILKRLLPGNGTNEGKLFLTNTGFSTEPTIEKE